MSRSCSSPNIALTLTPTFCTSATQSTSSVASSGGSLPPAPEARVRGWGLGARDRVRVRFRIRVRSRVTVGVRP